MASPQASDEKMQIYFKGTLVYTSNDVTVNLLRRLAALTGDMTARFKAILSASGASQ